MVHGHADQADFSFVHFTDTHIMVGEVSPSTTSARRADTQASLQRVIGVINTLEPRPAFAVIGGDLTSPDLLDRSRALTPEEYEPSYRRLQDLLSPLPCPTYMLMGNHDNRTAFHRVMQTGVSIPDAAHYYSFDYQGYHFIALDSLQPGEAGGFLNAVQLAWLGEDLEAHREMPTLVFVHHHPWPLGLKWLDDMRLHNGDDLVGLLRTFPGVRWIICGHVHLDHASQRHGLTMLTTPSTCFQISKLSQTRKILPGPPGLRVVWVKGFDLSTRVIHLHGEGLDAV
jgi:3',5'-cyclic AMP phosphodiesterase CpdA